MTAKVKFGLLAGVIGLLLNIPTSAFACVFCGPLVALLAGFSAGSLTARSEPALRQGDAQRQAAVAGIVAGALVLIGQLIGIVISAVTDLGRGAVEVPPQLSEPVDQASILVASLGCGLVIGLVDIAVSAAGGALAGRLATPTAPPVAPRVETAFERYGGTGVCDVCNRDVEPGEAYLVPVDVFYRSEQYRKWLRSGPLSSIIESAGGVDAYLKHMRSMDKTEHSAVCPDCIGLFRPDRLKKVEQQQVSPAVLRVLEALRNPDMTARLTVMAQAGILLMENAPGALEPFLLALKDEEVLVRTTVLVLLQRLDRNKLRTALKTSEKADQFIRTLKEIADGAPGSGERDEAKAVLHNIGG
jgi:hypothetical protein